MAERSSHLRQWMVNLMLVLMITVFPATDVTALSSPAPASPGGMPVPPVDKKLSSQDTAGVNPQRWVERFLPTQPEEVLVVYNSNYTVDSNANSIPDGQEIAEYYQAARDIPAANICAIACATTEVISRTEYDTNVRPAIESYLETNGLTFLINYVVLTKGIPLKIPASGSTEYGYADYSSVDSSLMLMFQTYSVLWRQANPYYSPDSAHNMNRRFQSFGYTNGSGVTLSYLTSRLDGYTLEHIFGMIDRGLNPYMAGGGTYVIDDHQKPYDRMAAEYSILHNQGERTNPDPWEDLLTWITSDEGSGVMGYCSHGVHAGMPDGYYQTTLTFSYLNGAVCNTYESYNAYGFASPDQSSHGQLAEFVMMGGTGGVGHCYEPWTDAVANEAVMFPAYAAGYSLADAIHMSVPWTDFVNVVIGDPMCIIEFVATPTPSPTPTATPMVTPTPMPVPSAGTAGISIMMAGIGLSLFIRKRQPFSMSCGPLQ